VSNGVYFVRHIGFLLQATHWVFSPAFFAGKSGKNKAIQHNFQLPKRWSGWGDIAKIGLLAQFD
jgi:hypothetical protein